MGIIQNLGRVWAASLTQMLFIYDLKRPAAIKNLYVLFDKKQNVFNGVVIYVPILQ